MKSYPSIPHSSKAPRKPCYIFVKLDGSNLRFCWSKKQGWHKFGTRKLLFDETSPIFGSAIPLFLQKYADDLEKAFKHKDFRGVDQFTVFAEWFGAKSFAGAHDPDDPKDIVIFDVNPLKKGILLPQVFLDHFGHLKVAELIGHQNLTDQLIQDVREEKIDVESKYEIRTAVPEGVICKGGDSGHSSWMTKIKTHRYYEELKARRPQDWESLWE
jgi:hypothetical protein